MRAKISKKDLFLALSHSISIVDKKPAIQILSHVLLEFINEKIVIKATDLDHSIIEEVKAEVDTFGCIAVSAQMFYDVVRKIPDESVIELVLSEKGEKLQIKSGKSKFEIQTLPADDFPKIDLLNKDCDFQIPSDNLKELIDKTKFSMAIEETRYNLNGIYFHTDTDFKNIIAVATDGHRLSICRVPNCGCNGNIGILARKTVMELRKLLDSNTTETVEVFKNNNQVQFVFGSITLTARLVDADFPKYEAVVPEKNEGSCFVIDRSNFVESIDRVSVISEDKTKSVRLVIEEDILHISCANSITGGSGQDEVKIQRFLEKDWEACFNARYLIDVANALNCDELKVYVKDKLSSILIIPVDKKIDCTFVVMPMRI